MRYSLTYFKTAFQAKYINECIDEIKNELKTGNISSKANAVNKLAYVRTII